MNPSVFYTNVDMTLPKLTILICDNQGPVGVTGAKGARGAAGPPVSTIILYFLMSLYIILNS